MLGVAVSALKGLFPDFLVYFRGNSTEFMGAIFKAKVARPCLKRFEIPLSVG